MRWRFTTKEQARQAVWDRLQSEGLARFPFPPHGRIPNFKGAQEAATRLFELPLFAPAKRIKVNPDAPQRYVREEALRRGITVYVPTPRLRAGFKRLDPARVPSSNITEAASLSKGRRWAEDVALADLPTMDAIVCGSVAVTRSGRRCGKGEGYSDLEYAILRELGHPPVPVLTTVHAVQVVEDLPWEATDLPLSAIVTPAETIQITNPPPEPHGITWHLLTAQDYEEMPVLQELRQRVLRRLRSRSARRHDSTPKPMPAHARRRSCRVTE
ncbi:MAG TPA: 5-formyltetrahydrofolate cyclo-ligase [Nitrospiraceae bacterium]|nr:5-formyltetrahydrofolate cyclo-ligase [Nitrospiraceae bacterium]